MQRDMTMFRFIRHSKQLHGQSSLTLLKNKYMSALESFLDACCVDKTSNLRTTKIPKLALKKMDDGDFYVDNQAYMELWMTSV